jgi:hypothetical protein
VTVGSKITNAVAANGTATTMGLSVSSAFDNITGQGTTTTTGGVYPTTAIQDGFYTQTYEGATNLGKIKLENLNPALRYNLIFFGSRNDDASGNNRMTTYRVGSTSVRMNSLSNVSNVVSLVNMAPAGDGTIEIQARNDNVGYGYLNVLEVQIVAANTAPVVGAGSNQSITLPATANLSGTVSDDGLPVGGTVTQTWSKFSGPGSVNFGNASALSTTASFSQAGTYVLRLTASDTSLSASSDVTITVAAAGGYSSWQSQQSWNGGNNTEMADPDGDGITNLVEYALGLNPVSAGTTGLPVTNVSGPNVTFTYTKDTSKTDVTYQVQSSPDLGSWTNVTSVRSGPPGTIETWVATVPQDTTKKFLRLQVTK